MTLTVDRELPRSDESEVSVLGGMMLEGDAADTGLELLTEADFFHDAHKKIFRAIRSLRDGRHLPDAMAVREELRRDGTYDGVGGDEYLARIVEIVPTAANLRYHARVVREMALRRRLVVAGTRVVELAHESDDIKDVMDAAERTIFDATQDEKNEGDGLVAASALIRNTLDMIMAGDRHRVPTGFTDLDELIGGFAPGELVLLAARPSVGKTALGFQVASNVALHQQAPVAIFSLEMGREIAITRLISADACVNLQTLAQGHGHRLQPHELEAMDRTVKRLQTAPVFIDDDGGLTIYELRARARRRKSRDDIRLIVVDYLQLLDAGMGGRGETNRTQEVGAISRGLKRLAGELDVPILALAQLNRGVESRDNKRPRLSDLRDSGELEQDADVVMFLHREDYYDPASAKAAGTEGMTELIVAKQRNGPIGTVKLHFDKRYSRFSDWSNAKPQGW